MKTFCFLNNKGGVGKTASVTTIGHMMATEFKKRVLIVDMDPQHNTTARFSSHEWVEIYMSIYKGENLDASHKSVENLLLDLKEDPSTVIQKTDYENLDLIPAYLTLATCEEMLKADVTIPQQYRLKTQLEKVANDYDYCLIDCSPSINILNVNALVAADEVYLPIRTDGDSCIGMAISLNLIRTVQSYNPQLEVGGVFITQCTWNEGVAKTTYEILSMSLPKGTLIPIQIGNTKYLKENSFMQKPLLLLDKGKNKSPATKAYLLLTEYMLSPNKEKFLEDHQERINELKHLDIEGE